MKMVSEQIRVKYITETQKEGRLSDETGRNQENKVRNGTQKQSSSQSIHKRVATQKKLEYNIYFPEETQQIYYPMMEFKGAKDEIINELELIRLALERDRNSPDKSVTTFYFFSPPGLGKTVMGGYLAQCYEAPYQIINCVNSMIDLDLLGSQILVGEDTAWQDGPLPAIIRATNKYGIGILIINELNALTVNAQMALNPLLDRQEGVVLTQNNNEYVRVEPPNHLLIIASMNPDVFGIHDLQDSVRDRASAILEMSYPPVEKEALLIEHLTKLPEKWARKYCEVISECRRAKYIDKTITKAPSTRALLDWINYSGVWGPMLAFQMTIANRYCSGYSEEEREILIKLAKGKGVKQWKLDKEFEEISSVPVSDEFHFPSIQPIKREPKRPHPPINSKNKSRCKKKLEKAAEDLQLSPLDSFLSPKDKKSPDKK